MGNAETYKKTADAHDSEDDQQKAAAQKLPQSTDAKHKIEALDHEFNQAPYKFNLPKPK